MKKVFLLVISICLFAMCGLSAQVVVNPASALDKDPTVREGKLENGLTYYIRHNNKPEQRAEFYLVTNVGAIDETPAQDGLAHFLEHMALNGTKNLPGKMMINYFESIGVEFGRNINASTGVEQTMYMLSNIPVTRQGIIDTALLIMHDYSAFVTNAYEEIENERGVIIEEWRTRRTAAWRMQEQTMKYLYKGSKYESCTIIGDKNNLETFHPSELVKFYETWYRPDMQALIIVGDIDVDAIENQIKTLFADIPARENQTEKKMHKIPDNVEPIVGIVTDPEATGTSITVLYKYEPMPIEYKSLGIGFLNDMIQSLIGRMINERLSDIASKPDAPFLGAGSQFTSITNTMDAFYNYVAAKEGEGLKATNALMQEVERALRFGFTQSEYERATTNMLRSLERAAENADTRRNTEFVNSYMSDFFDGYPYLTPQYRYEVTKGYLSMITVDQINESFPRAIPKDNMVIIYQAPEKAGLIHPTEAQLIEAVVSAKNANLEPVQEEVSDQPLVDESKLKVSPVVDVKSGKFETTVWTLENGIRVYVKPTDYRKEEVIIRTYTPGGRSIVATEDLPSIDGNVFMMYLNNAGVSTFPQTELKKKLTGKLVSINPYIDDIEQGIGASTTPKDFETAMQLLYLMHAEPRFVESEYNTPIQMLASMLPNVIKTPDFIFQTEFVKFIYGNNPRQFIISEESFEKASFNTLEKIYRQLFGNCKDMVISIVGNVNPDEIKPLIEKYIGSLPIGEQPLKWRNRHEHIVSGVHQASIDVEMTTPKAKVALIYSGNVPYNPQNKINASALQYLMDIIYTKTIREDEGGTYGVSVATNISRLPEEEGLIQVMFDTNKEAAEKLLGIAKADLKKVAANGADAEQLQKIKENFLKNLPESRITNSYWQRMIAEYFKHSIDMDTNYTELVNGITSESIKKFAEELLKQGNEIEFIMMPKE